MSDLPPGSGDPLTNRPALNTASGPRRYRFPGTMRILRSREFERALRDGVRVNDQRLTLWGLPNGLSHARLGLIVGRKHGNAVRRNRIKRILRSAFRLSQHELPQGLDLVRLERPSPAFRHLRPAGIARAEEQNPRFSGFFGVIHLCRSSKT